MEQWLLGEPPTNWYVDDLASQCTAMCRTVGLSPLRLLAVDETLEDPSAPIQQQNYHRREAGTTNVRYAVSQMVATPPTANSTYQATDRVLLSSSTW